MQMGDYPAIFMLFPKEHSNMTETLHTKPVKVLVRQ